MSNLINRYVLPQVAPMTWKKFTKQHRPFGVALDGFVYGKSEFQDTVSGGPRANFNHHEEVDRDSTLATCMQVLNAIRGQFLQHFNVDGNPRMDLYVNDCDEDVCLSTYILENPARAKDPSNPLLNKLVNLAGRLDMFAGLIKLAKEEPILGQLAWIFYPYRKARLDGTIDGRSPVQFNEVINDVHHRIAKYLVGEGKSMHLRLGYEILGRGDGWCMIRETGEHARYGLLDDGITAFVSVRDRPDGRFSYSFCRADKFTYHPPVTYTAAKLNEYEGLTDLADIYGGGTNIGGSSRQFGSATKPKQMMEYMDTIVAEWKGGKTLAASNS